MDRDFHSSFEGEVGVCQFGVLGLRASVSLWLQVNPFCKLRAPKYRSDLDFSNLNGAPLLYSTNTATPRGLRALDPQNPQTQKGSAWKI